MTNKELSRLRRSELLEILIAQGKEQERLSQQLSQTEEALRGRELAIEESGSLADAAVRLSDVMGAAQRAADLYTENVRRVLDQQQQESDKALSDAKAYAGQLVADAEKRVRSMLDTANDQAARILQNARTEAENITAQALAQAEQTRADAQIESEAILAAARQQAGMPAADAEEPKKRRGLFGRRS